LRRVTPLAADQTGRSSANLNAKPFAIAFLASFKAILAFLRAQGDSPGVVSDEATLSVADCTSVH